MRMIIKKRNKSNNLYILYTIIFSIILLPTINVKIIPGFRVEQIIVLIAYIIFFLNIASKKNIRIKKNLFILMFLWFVFFIMLSIYIGSFKNIKIISNDFFEIYKVIVYIGIYGITVNIIQNNYQRQKVLKCIIICTLIASFIGFQQYFNLFGLNEKYIPIIAPTQYESIILRNSSRRIIGMAANPNVFSIMPSIAGLISWSFFLKTFKKEYLITLMIFFVTVLMTSSRAGLIFLVISLMFYSILELSNNVNKKNIYRIVKIIISIGIIIIVFILYFNSLPEELTWRIKLGFDIGEDTSFQARLLNWEEHINLFKKSPLFGLGPAKSIDYLHSVDNEWLLLIRQYGIIGTFYLVLVFFIPFIIQKKSLFKNIYFTTMLASAIYMIPAGIYHSFQLMPLVMIIAGLVPNFRE